MRAPASALPPLLFFQQSRGPVGANRLFITAVQKRAPVSGAEERTEGGRETNKAQLTDYSAKPAHETTSQDVRGKAKGKLRRLEELQVCGDGSSPSAWPNRFSDVQSKMAWFCTFLRIGAVFVSQMNGAPRTSDNLNA